MACPTDWSGGSTGIVGQRHLIVRSAVQDMKSSGNKFPHVLLLGFYPLIARISANVFMLQFEGLMIFRCLMLYQLAKTFHRPKRSAGYEIVLRRKGFYPRITRINANVYFGALHLMFVCLFVFYKCCAALPLGYIQI
jgi:hypothetical protein